MIQERLKQLRQQMRKAGIDYYYVPSADAHRNEYVPDCWQRRAWISGFTGSAGDVLIGKEHAYLWTDGRYFLQAEQQLDPSCFQLMKQQQGTPPIGEWLKNQGNKLRIGVDPQLLTLQQHKTWQTALANTRSKVIPITANLIDALWEDQPATPSTPIHRLDIRYAGREANDKLADLRQALKKQGAESTVLTRLDAIAWLFNIRGKDIDYNPLTIAYAIITQTHATLFIHPDKLSSDDLRYFQSQAIQTEEYRTFSKALNQLKGSVLLDPQNTSWWTYTQLKKATIHIASCPITLMKAIKNPTEQNGMREAHRIDAVAVIKFLHWIDNHWQEGITEIDAAKQLEQFRREETRCQDLSFETISAFASNAAVVHYSPEEHTNKTIDDTALYLLDSGGQYYEGTTDITRTLHLGQPSQAEKTHYTLVLKAQLALRHTQFPAGTFGEQIDAIARQHLWNAGYDYAHSTSHGVGCYLCVHEGPQAISPRTTRVPLEPGMAVSNEPGIYFKDRYGIRIENVCLIQAVDAHANRYTLEDLTLVPYACHLIDTNQLSSQEIDWINAYHQCIYERIAPNLPEGPAEWLKEATKPLPIH